MTAALLVPIIAASLMGSVHCAGMCGGFVAAYAGHGGEGSRLSQHVAYNSGRLLTYTALGAVAGALGNALDLAGKAAGIARIAALLSGLLLLAWGLARLLEARGMGHFRVRPPQWLSRLSYFWFNRHRDKPPAVRAALMGLSSTLLPCGWLYAFAVSAAGTGSAASGAVVMLAFWMGTVPMLLGLGLGVSSLSTRLRRHIPVVSALLLTAVGVFTIVTRLNLPAFAQSAPAGAARSAVAVPEMPACHQAKHR